MVADTSTTRKRVSSDPVQLLTRRASVYFPLRGLVVDARDRVHR